MENKLKETITELILWTVVIIVTITICSAVFGTIWRADYNREFCLANGYPSYVYVVGSRYCTNALDSKNIEDIEGYENISTIDALFLGLRK
jgi:hypothetical protein